jgi:hypothetical protein
MPGSAMLVKTWLLVALKRDRNRPKKPIKRWRGVVLAPSGVAARY